MKVALVTVGDELLAGDTVNTNAAWLGRSLAERGVSVERMTVVPDRTSDIAQVVNEYAALFDAVIVTGGLGPTHDDVTIEAVAAAVGKPIDVDPMALEWLETEGGYSHEELAEGTADLPVGAEPLHNEVGVAPGCIIENIYVLPGVPAEMKAMFETIADAFTGADRYVKRVAIDEPESALLDRLATLRSKFDVKIGSYPGEYVRIKIEGSDPDTVAEAICWLRAHAAVIDD